jgi:hypothetical protein
LLLLAVVAVEEKIIKVVAVVEVVLVVCAQL